MNNLLIMKHREIYLKNIRFIFVKYFEIIKKIEYKIYIKNNK
jgi:hypothetical protein